jgi:sulfur-oxidizing protein SoxX
MIRNVALAVVLLAAPAAVRAQTPGENIAFDRAKGNCLACHTMRGGDVPSSVGPELKGMKERFPERADLVAIVTNEQTRNPQTVMPPFGLNLILNDDEISRIVDFLYTL